jgi:uncharacterized protein (TIGR03118 family)
MNIETRRLNSPRAALCVMCTTLVPAMASAAGTVDTAANNARTYVQTNLVSDGFVPAAHSDAHLVDPWGLVIGPTNPAWVADRGGGVATVFDGKGEPFPIASPLVVTIPKGVKAAAVSGPTGIIITTATAAQFVVTSGGKSAPASFVFATIDGTIAGWAPAVLPTTAVTAVDNSASGAMYTGLAQANNGTATFLYAVDFHGGKVLPFDVNFKAATLTGKFEDPQMLSGFAPFGIQNIGGVLFVTYVPVTELENKGASTPGQGIVDIFDANGNFVRRFAELGPLNAPWGVAQAPSNFGEFSNDILVGNFGGGNILAYDPNTGRFKGELEGSNGKPIMNPGLWTITFGNGLLNQGTNTLFFTAGLDGGQHGVYGQITATVATNETGEDAIGGVAY